MDWWVGGLVGWSVGGWSVGGWLVGGWLVGLGGNKQSMTFYIEDTPVGGRVPGGRLWVSLLGCSIFQVVGNDSVAHQKPGRPCETKPEWVLTQKISATT